MWRGFCSSYGFSLFASSPPPSFKIIRVLPLLPLWPVQNVVRQAICVIYLVEYLAAPADLGVQEDKSNACQHGQHPAVAAASPEHFQVELYDLCTC